MPRANMHPWSIINVEDGKLILPPICEVCHKPLKKREMKYLRTKDGGYISCTCEKCVARMLSQDIEGFEIKQNEKGDFLGVSGVYKGFKLYYYGNSKKFEGSTISIGVDGEVEAKQIIDSYLKSRGEIPTCPSCGRQRRLYSHHWYEPPEYQRQQIYICAECNNKLRQDIWGKYADRKRWLNHILPSWDIQLLWLKGREMEVEKCISAKYSFPLPYPPWER